MSSARSGVGKFLGALGMVLRVLAWAMTALVVADSFVSGAVRSLLLPVNTMLGRAVPDVISGVLVFQTHLGGAFRGDFALVAAILFVLDWAACTAASSLR